ncbi:MAG: hypothetical protein BZY79_05545 [SAR202 cluster bacterium Casp-Chloro-G4]|nr:hypothetical protein [Chloroflexota bacterium]MDA1228824.1 hypothetical protein [Chloroflexota bacterium]PKB61086.1 MAG: hypothetical protein BZY79_05545 [SAR202 cluster bacterium Casp-Chloro-G4]
MSFSEWFDFWAIFYVGYAVYLAVTSAVAIFWIVYARRSRGSALASSTDFIATVMKFQYKLVFSLVKLGRPPAKLPSAIPTYKQMFTVAGTTGVVVATSAGIIVFFLQWVESLA